METLNPLIWTALGMVTIGSAILHHAFDRPVPMTQDLWLGGAIILGGVLTGLRGCGIDDGY